MNMAKRFGLKFMLVALLVLGAIYLSACAKIRVMTDKKEDGSIEELVFIDLKEDEFYSQEELAAVKEDILIIADEELNNAVMAFNLQVIGSMPILFETITPILSEWEGNSLTVGLKFKNEDSYNYYYGITEENQVEPKIEKHFLYDKVIYEGYTSFAVQESVYNRVKTRINEDFPFLTTSSTELFYTHISELRRLHSDADFVDKINGRYYHTWKLAEGDTNKKITLYYNLANRGNCTIVCLLLGLLICGLLLIIGLLISKNKKKLKINLISKMIKNIDNSKKNNNQSEN